MAQSSRSIVLALQTNLHAAFDADLGRIHTIWVGGPLNLWGPPYSYAKTPFLATIQGRAVYSLPKFSPWFHGKESLPAQFRGLALDGSQVNLHFALNFPEQPIEVVESLQGDASNRNWIVRRTLRFPAGTPQEIRLLTFAEGGAAIQRISDQVLKATGTNGTVYITLPQGSGFNHLVRTEAVDYQFEIITETGTEKGNPKFHIQGEENRSYVVIPKRTERFELQITLSSSQSDMPIRELSSIPQKTYSAAPETRRFSGDEFFEIEHFPLPPEAELLITGMDWLNPTDLAVCTWLGEIYIVEQAAGPVQAAKFRRFARGLDEPLGLTVHKGRMYVVQKGELTRVEDQDGDGEADHYKCVNNSWGYSGNYHSYSFGPLIAPDESFFVFITGQRGRYDVPFQGWALQISPDGSQVTPFCNGLRVPHGWGWYGPDHDVFVTENQGNWIGACKLNHLQKGKFYGFPSSMPAPRGVRKAEEVEPPVLWFPRSLSPSTSGFTTITTDAFGPFQGQLLIGDFQNSIVMRACLEQVRGQWQGAVFPFAKGFLSGVNRLAMSQDGRLYVGGGKRTWSTAAPREYALDRVRYTGKLPFEVREVRALKNGFELRFTQDLEPEAAKDPANYLVKQFNYRYSQEYGSPEFDHEGNPGATEVAVEAVDLLNGKTARLRIPGLKPGFVTSFQLAISNTEDEDLRHDQFYYTLNAQPN